MLQLLLCFTFLVLIVITYIWLLNRALSGTPIEVRKLADKPWEEEDLRVACKRLETSPIDVKPFLKPKTGRRYIVVGGSGMVGSRIVLHLLLRGENPAAIRILDLQIPTQPEIIENHVAFITVDVTDQDSIRVGFETPWPVDIPHLPLTVFHCVAYIAFRERYATFLSRYLKVNVEGTRNVIDHAQAAGATILIATASGSIGPQPPSYFIWPWQRRPRRIFQLLSAATRRESDTLGSMVNCYAYSKAQAEALVLSSHSPNTSFYTGCVRPCNAIYAQNIHSSANIAWDYLRRGHSKSWLHDIVGHFVDAENVSIAHLAYEYTLLKQQNTASSSGDTVIQDNVGGRTYYVTDPNPPVTYGQLYATLTYLAHPFTPQRYDRVPPGPMFLFAHLIELYEIVWTLTPLSRFFPPLSGDLAVLQPGLFNVSTAHYLFDDRDARREIGYVAPITTMEGFARAVLDWNKCVEKKVGNIKEDLRE